MNKERTVLLTLIVFVIAGCAQQDNAGRYDLPIVTDRIDPVEIVESNNGPPDADSVPPQQPAEPTVIEKLSLGQAFAIARRHHLELKVITSQMDEATGAIMQAGVLPDPEIIARTESAPFSGSTAGEAEYVAGISQRIPSGKRLSVARKVEEQKKKKLSVELRAKRLEIRTQVQSAFAQALFWEQAVDVYAGSLEQATNALAIAQARFEAGDTVATEVGQAGIETQRIELELDGAKSQYLVAKEKLLTAMGNPPLRINSLENMAQSLSKEIPNLDELVANLDKHPLVAVAQAENDVEKLRYNLVEEERKVDLGLEVTYRKLADDRDAFDVGIRIPLPMSSRKAGRRHQARAAVRTAQLRSRQVRREVEYDLRQFHSALNRSISAARLLQDQIVPQSRKLLTEMEKRYEAGDISMTELLPVRRDAIATRLKFLKALRDAMDAQAKLIACMAEDIPD